MKQVAREIARESPQRKRGVKIACGLLSVVLAITVSEAGNNGTGQVPTPQKSKEGMPKKAVDYWTPENLPGAEPIELQHSSDPHRFGDEPTKRSWPKEREDAQGGTAEGTGLQFELRQGQMICLDTDFIIDHLKNKQDTDEAIRTGRADLVTTEVNRFQVYLSILDKAVVNQQELAAARTFFSRIGVLPFGIGSGEGAARILADLRREGKGIDETDCFIAATMIHHGCSRVLTRDKDRFAGIPGISGEPYWTPERLRDAEPFELPHPTEPPPAQEESTKRPKPKEREGEEGNAGEGVGYRPVEKTKEGMPEEREEYWTRERLRGAQPLELPHPSEPAPSGEEPAKRPLPKEQEGAQGGTGEGAGLHVEPRQRQIICLDTDFITDYLNNKPEVVEAIPTARADFVTTEVNRFQVYLSILDKTVVNQQRLAAARSFFSKIDVLPFGNGSGEEAARTIAELRREQRGIDESGCFIAATMTRHGCSRVLTRDKNRFAGIPGITVMPY